MGVYLIVKEMRKLLFVIIFFIPLFGLGQKDATYYYGVNGKIDDPAQKDMMKTIDYRGKSRINVKTFKSTKEGWQQIYSEKIKVVNDTAFYIRMKGDKFSGKIMRTFQPLENGNFEFTDRIKNGIKRQGITKQKVPMILDGEVTEYYENGRKRSVSQYRNNELVSNKNWQADGTQLVDDIFYSVEQEPLFEPGMEFINQQVLRAIKDAEFDLSTVQGRMIMCLVITKEGEIGGVSVVDGISQTLNGIMVKAFGNIKGAWKPAKLNGEDVNYFQLFPINFIYNQYNFDSLEYTGGMLFWVIH